MTQVVADKEQKYDRQLRCASSSRQFDRLADVLLSCVVSLWGANGQAKLEAASLCLLNADAVGAETLKNLILPGWRRLRPVNARADISARANKASASSASSTTRSSTTPSWRAISLSNALRSVCRAPPSSRVCSRSSIRSRSAHRFWRCASLCRRRPALGTLPDALAANRAPRRRSQTTSASLTSSRMSSHRMSARRRCTRSAPICGAGRSRSLSSRLTASLATCASSRRSTTVRAVVCCARRA